MFSENNINFLIDFFHEYGKLKSWSVFKMECNLNDTFYVQWLQLTDAIPKTWKNIVHILI